MMNTIKEIIDLYQWLPNYGENSVSFFSKGLDVILTVTYDVEDDTRGEYASRDLLFKKVCSFEKSTFPGALKSNKSITLNETPKFTLGSLVELIDSDKVNDWNTHFKDKRVCNHFIIHFLSENMMFEIIADSVELSPIEYFN